MKKVLLSFLLIGISIFSFAQETPKEPESQSKSVEFLSKNGSFILKEFYDVGKVKGVTCQVLIMTNIKDNTKMGCLRLETTYSSSYTTDSYIGTLDVDELDACIQSLEYISNNLLPTTPAVYTEAEYKTRDKVRLGAYYNERKAAWSAFVYTTYSSRSCEFLDSSNITSLITIMEKAKNLIKEKTNK